MSNSLQIEDISQIKSNLDFGIHTTEQKQTIETELDAKADQLVSSLVDFDHNDEKKKLEIRHAVESMAYEVQKEASKQSAMLKQPLATIQHRSEDGGDVSNALIDLKLQVEELDPARFDFDEGFVSRIMGYIPGVGNAMKRYFSKYESAQTVIAAIIKSLEAGRDIILRDNITLAEDQKRMREMTQKLEKAIVLGQLIDNKLVYKIEREIDNDLEKKKFIEEEVLFTLRQRIQDLQQQLAVNQQGVLAMEIVIRNNKELVRGVNRGLNVTVSALQTAVTIAIALNNQKIVLDKINALSATTDNLIANTAKRLKTQGSEIHKAASSTGLNIETLRTAFADINAALDDIAQFRSQALPVMADNILQMNQLTEQAEKKIKTIEQSNLAASTIHIDPEG